MKKLVTLVCSLYPSLVLASTGSGVLAPVTHDVQKIRLDLGGATAREFIFIALIGAGLLWAFSEHGHGARKVAAVLIGGSLVFGTVAIITALGWSGALI